MRTKKVVRLNESQLRQIVKESVKKILREYVIVDNNIEYINEDWKQNLKGVTLGTALGAASLFGGNSTASAQYTGKPFSVEYHHDYGYGKSSIDKHEGNYAIGVDKEVKADLQLLYDNGKRLSNSEDGVEEIKDLIKFYLSDSFGYSGGAIDVTANNELDLINNIQKTGAIKGRFHDFKLALVKVKGRTYLLGFNPHKYISDTIQNLQ